MPWNTSPKALLQMHVSMNNIALLTAMPQICHVGFSFFCGIINSMYINMHVHFHSKWHQEWQTSHMESFCKIMIYGKAIQLHSRKEGGDRKKNKAYISNKLSKNDKLVSSCCLLSLSCEVSYLCHIYSQLTVLIS